MKVGDLVRHTEKPDWGVGVIVAVGAANYVINFEGRDQAILRIVAASKWLTSVDSESIPSESPLLDPDRWTELELPPELRKTKGSRTTKAACVHCQKPLNRGQYSEDRTLKSCPLCSSDDGTHHIFYACPDGFGRSEERVSEDNPDGDQSYCYQCRGREMSEAPIRCSSVVQ